MKTETIKTKDGHCQCFSKLAEDSVLIMVAEKTGDCVAENWNNKTNAPFKNWTALVKSYDECGKFGELYEFGVEQ